MGLHIIRCCVIKNSTDFLSDDVGFYPISEYTKIAKRFKEFATTNDTPSIYADEYWDIGSNCLSKEWLDEYDKIESLSDTWDFCTIFPEEVETLLLPYLDLETREDHHPTFNKENLEKPFDFLYISW